MRAEVPGLRSCRLLPLILLVVALTAAADAGTPVGKVKRCEGSVSLERAGLLQRLQVGSPLQVGDRVRTGVDGAVPRTAMRAVSPGAYVALSAMSSNDSLSLSYVWSVAPGIQMYVLSATSRSPDIARASIR